MNNVFVRLVLESKRKRWCVKPYCTTCGCREFRNRLEELTSDGGEVLTDALSNLTPQQIISLPNWEDCVSLGLAYLSLPGQHERLLQAWIRNLDGNTRFADEILFYFVRRLPFRREVGSTWTSECVKLAMSEHDELLVESLLWTLGPEAR